MVRKRGMMRLKWYWEKERDNKSGMIE
jgi:hypothetical protein